MLLVVTAWVIAVVGAAVAVSAAVNLGAAPLRALAEPTPSMGPAVKNLVLLLISAAVTSGAVRFTARLTNQVHR
ncbi:MAG: hypothetical protein AB1673_14500 [Actinomycetota bacterium]